MCSGLGRSLGHAIATRHRDTPSHRALRKRWHPKRGGTPPSPGCPHPSLPGRQAYHILDELLIAGELQATSRHHALAPASATSALVLFSISVPVLAHTTTPHLLPRPRLRLHCRPRPHRPPSSVQEPSKKAILRVTAAQDALMEGSGDSKVSDSKYEI